MPSGVEVAKAYITIIPEMHGIQGTIAKELGAEKIGTDAGKKLGEGVAKGASQSSSELMKSFGSVGDRIAFKTKASLGLAFDSVAKSARDRIGGVASTIGERFEAVGQTISGSGIGKAFSSVAGIASAAFSKVTGTIRGVAQFAADGFKGVASKVGSFLAPIASKAGEVFGKVGAAAGKGFDAVVKAAAIGAAAATASLVAVSKGALDAYASYEQLSGGAQQIFSAMDYSKIEADAQRAYRTMGMSANDYLESINQVGAAFKATMGDERGYDTAKRGMQAISDYASGTGRSVEELNDKYAMITRSTSSYQSIADQFSGILPATSDGFLKSAQAAGLLSGEYTSLTEVPIAEYQQAVTGMLERGVDALGLTGNTAHEATQTITGSMDMVKGAWSNFLAELGKDDADIEARVSELVDGVVAVAENVVPRVAQIVGRLAKEVPDALAKVAPRLTEAMSQMLNDMTDGAFGRAVDAIRPHAERIGRAVSGLVDRLKPLLPVAQDIGGKMGGILVSGIRAAADAIEWLSPIVATIAETALPILSDAVGAAGRAFEAALDFLKPVGDFLGEVLPPIIEWVGQRIEDLGRIVGEVFDGIGGVIEGAASFLKDPFKAIGDLFSNTGKTAQTTSKTTQAAFSNMNRGVTNSAKSTQTGVSSSWSAIARSAGTTQSSISGAWSRMSSDTTSKFTKASGDATAQMGTLQSNVDSKTRAAQLAATANFEVMRANLVSKATSAQTETGRRATDIKNAWDKSYTMKVNASADTSQATSTLRSFQSSWNGYNVHGTASISTWGADSSMSWFRNSWNGYNISGYASVSTWGAEQSLRNLINGWSGFTVRGNAIVSSSGGGGGHYTYATGAIVQRHADGFIANRRGTGVDITHHIAGEAGAEAIIPLTNRRYVAPFAKTVADFINEPAPGGVTVTGNTFVVRKDSDIPAIGRAINLDAERKRRAKL